LSIELLQHEEEQLDKLAEDEFRVNYQQEYKKALKQAEDEWYPYRAAGILGNEELDLWEDSEVKRILRHRRSEYGREATEKYLNAIIDEVNKAFQRRALSNPTYDTEWGFRVKSKGEQLLANALRFYTFTDRTSGECNRVALLYEPFFRIPEENRIIIPDFVIPEYCLVIEYAGLEERSYKFGLHMKMEAINKLGFPFVIIRPGDLDDLPKTLNQKLKFYFDLMQSDTKPF
jgi:hypothetical protein